MERVERREHYKEGKKAMSKYESRTPSYVQNSLSHCPDLIRLVHPAAV